MSDKPIRILHVLGYFDHGGTESLVMNVFREMDRSKIMFDFVVHSQEEGYFEEEVLAMGSKIHRVPKYKGHNHLAYKKSWNDLFDKHPEYSIVHGHVRSTASIYLKIAKQHGLKTIAHSHSVSSGAGLSGMIKNLMQRKIVDNADELLACSLFAGEWLFGTDSVLESNFHVMKNAIDAEKYIYDTSIRTSLRNELNLQDKCVIGHVGRFHESKNHERLIDIFNEVQKLVSNAVLLLVGEGQLLPDMKRKVEDLGISDKVQFLGSRSDVSNVYQAMDVFLFPSLYEGLGIAVVEAQASGLHCVVATSIPEEAIYTNLVDLIPLQEKNEVWVDAVKAFTGNRTRGDVTLEDIKNAQYDIKGTADWYSDFILSNNS